MDGYQQRLRVFLVAVAGVLLLFAGLYWMGMTHLEGTPRTFLESFTWAVETMTTTGYGNDSMWQHPALVALVTLAQFSGVLMVFLLFPLLLFPLSGCGNRRPGQSSNQSAGGRCPTAWPPH